MRCQVRAALLAFALLCAVSVQASQFATGGTEAIVPGTGDVTHTFTSDGTFTLSQATTVRLLVVGGGGGGGRDCAGGGGGGGVIAVDSVVLPAGSYTVTVGAGGAGGTSGAGGNGGATTIADAGGTVLYKALGGGGGVGWSGSTPVSSESAPFASGGGGTNNKAGSTAGDPTQGHDGGSTSGNNRPAGGGGAGGPGLGADDRGNGNGGPGIVSDITGVTEMYGAGGGGGSYSGRKQLLTSVPGEGGDGYWGFGVPEPYHPSSSPYSHGREGYGGGGGGGNNMVSNGADGGSGCAIFRLSNVDPAAAAPSVVEPGLISATPFEATLSATLASPGAGAASASVFLQVAEDAAEVADAAEIAAAPATNALYAAMASGLRPAHTYHARFVARNGSAEISTAVFSFTTAALVENPLRVPSSSPHAGLLQHRGSGTGLSWDFDETTAGNVVAAGACAGGAGNKATTSLHGTSWTDANGTSWSWPGSTHYGYIGKIWLRAGHVYHFFGHTFDSTQMDMDGTRIFSVNDGGGQAAVGTVECLRTGWHDVKIWFGGDGGTIGVRPGHRYGIGWNEDGTEWILSVPNKGWEVFENPAGGDAFLAWETPWRDVAVSSYAPGASGIDFEVALGASDCDATELHCVWGDIYGGENTNAWAHDELVCTVGDTAQTASYTLVGTTGSPLVRFYALHADGTTTWSGTSKIDLENVSVSDLGVNHDGDEGTFSVRVGGVGSGTFSLTLQVATDSAFSGIVTNVAVAAASAGDYAATIPLIPATGYWYRWVATDGSSSDQTSDAAFTTAAGADIADATTASAYRHTVTFNGTLDDFGAGAATLVTLWYGDSADALVESAFTTTLATSGAFTFSATIPGATRKVFYKLVASNTARRGTSWTDETAVASVDLNERDVEYTWIGGTEGDWEDPANWRSNTSTNNCHGWPAMGSVSARFPAGTVATVHVHGYYAARPVLNTTGSSVTLVGEGQGTGFDYGDVSGGAMNGTTFSFENMRICESDIWDYQIGSPTSTNSVLRIASGTTVSQGGNKEAILGTNSCFVVESGAVQNCTFLLLLQSYGEGLRIDDGVCRLGSVAVATPAAGVCPQSLRIRGANGLLEVKNGIFGDLVGQSDHKSSLFKTDLPLLGDFDVVFEPTGPFTNVVSVTSGGETTTLPVALYSTKDSGRAFGEMLVTGSTGKIRLSVDTASMRGSFKGAKQHFVLWKGGIDTNSVELVQGDKYALSYTYGWPSVNDEPENVDDLPTGVWAEVSGTGGFILIIR